MSVKRNEIINQICSKAGITRRNSKQKTFTKHELLLLNSHLDLVQGRLLFAAEAITEKQVDEATKE